MENYNDEREISLGGLMVYVFKAWKAIIAFMLAFGIIFSGGKYLKDNLKSRDYAKKQENSVEMLSPQEKSEVLDLLNEEKCYNNILETNNHSCIMKFNPAKMYRATLTYWIEAQENILSFYITDLSDDEWKKNIIKKLDVEMDIREFNELLSVSLTDETLNIQVKYDDLDSLKTIVAQIENEVEETNAKLREHLSNHLPKQINKVTETIYDQSLLDLQNEKLSLMEEKEKSIKDKKAALNENQLLAYNFFINDGKIDEKHVSISIKALALGLLLGAFIECAYRGFSFLLQDKLRYDDNVRGLTGLKELGAYKDFNEEKNPINKLLNSISAKRLRGLNQQQQIDVIVSNIVFESKENGKAKVFVDVVSEKCLNLSKELKAQLSKSGIDAEIVCTFMKNINQLDFLTEKDSVVLVVKCDETDYTQIKNEIDICTIHKKSILGIITEI